MLKISHFFLAIFVLFITLILILGWRVVSGRFPIIA
jgi:hypothetical protein